MDPTIAAALITGGVGALGIAGTVVGSRNTRKATEQGMAASTASTMATLAAAREDRLWEKRASVYEEAIAALLHRQRKRQHDTRRYRLDEEAEKKLREFFDGYEPPGWFQVQVRAVAYASDRVLGAFDEAELAHRKVWGCYRRWVELAEDNQLAVEAGNPSAVDGGAAITARKAIDPALDEAEEKDQALVDLIRDELRSKPEAATLPASQPVEHHVFWRRTS